MAETATIEMQDREMFAAMAMQALITRGEGWAADMIAKQAVAYADALIEALAADSRARIPESLRFIDSSKKKPRRCLGLRGSFSAIRN